MLMIPHYNFDIMPKLIAHVAVNAKSISFIANLVGAHERAEIHLSN